MTRKNRILTHTLLALVGVGGLTAATAKADWHGQYGPPAPGGYRDDRPSRDHDWDRRDWHRDYDRDRGGWDLHIGDIFAPPIQQTTTQRFWVEPVYRTVSERVWVEPVYRTDTTRVWVPPVIDTRDRVGWEHGRRVVFRENVEIAPGHYEDQIQHVVVCEGHWQNVDHTEVVSAGHWEDRVVITDCPPQRTGYGFNLNFRGH